MNKGCKVHFSKKKKIEENKKKKYIEEKYYNGRYIKSFKPGTKPIIRLVCRIHKRINISEQQKK